ncbi:spore germination protein [Falsibacillus albus]|uniref:Spore germination protein n=1 Tax=Falsibacillus albus TaxID=2478915 RepID=A0A3L7K2G2_9BACI|nr:spore germination protein [Falsibacillus albus]RLQ97246.1 spore germination protein [Falsibacillus albus]
MPAFSGSVQVMSVNGGTVHFGDTAVNSPKSASKSTTGAASINSGSFFDAFSFFSINGTLNNSLIEQPTAGNN